MKNSEQYQRLSVEDLKLLPDYSKIMRQIQDTKLQVRTIEEMTKIGSMRMSEGDRVALMRKIPQFAKENVFNPAKETTMDDLRMIEENTGLNCDLYVVGAELVFSRLGGYRRN